MTHMLPYTAQDISLSKPAAPILYHYGLEYATNIATDLFRAGQRRGRFCDALLEALLVDFLRCVVEYKQCI